jgi:hypothetical protein
MDITYLSRKFVLSAVLATLATLFMAIKLIAPIHWQWVIMSTVVTYVAANAIIGHNKTGNREMVGGVMVSMTTIWERLKALFGRTFLLAFVTVLVCSAFLLKGIIPSEVWFVICSALAGAYNIGNALSKTG